MGEGGGNIGCLLVSKRNYIASLRADIRDHKVVFFFFFLIILKQSMIPISVFCTAIWKD